LSVPHFVFDPMTAPVKIIALDVKRPEMAARILALHVAAYALEAELAGVAWLPPMKRSVADVQALPESFFGVAGRGQLAGAISVEEAVGQGEVDICSVAVAPAFQRLGLGRALVRFVIAGAAGRPLVVATAAANSPALALYRSEGFAEFKRSVVMSPSLEIVHLRRAGGDVERVQG
jgi:ribosomal protein S18 acetylase RimI-like enzyme